MSTLHDIEAAARVMDREIREPDAAAVTEDQARRVIDAVQAFARTHRISEAAIGRATGYAQSAIWQALRMKYPGNWRQIILDLDRWLEDQRKTPPAVSGFVRSVVAERVYALAEMAIHTRRIAAGYGPSGIGKSVAVRALMADKPGSVLVSVESFAATPAGVMDAVAHAVGVIDPARRAVSSRQAALAVKQLLAGSGRLLIVDEVHKLMHRRNHAALTVLRDLFDHTGCPQLWISTIDVLAFLESNGGPREPLSQVRTRLIHCADLTEGSTNPDGDGDALFTIEQVRELIAARKMRLVPAAELALWRLINRFDGGYLRTLDSILQLAAKLQASGPISVETIRKAAAILRIEVPAAESRQGGRNASTA